MTINLRQILQMRRIIVGYFSSQSSNPRPTSTAQPIELPLGNHLNF